MAPGNGSRCETSGGMVNDYHNQADRADTIADQTIDESLKATLREAAKEYRSKVAAYALFRGNSQLTRTYASREEVLQAAVLEGLIPAKQGADQIQTLPDDHSIKQVEQIYGSRPDWKHPRDIS